ncbi:MAG: hypothetical protein OEY52_01675 [Gammaproteobacteria bacterium]|nr:hypothetical protein [Gammaproteobacteria bacterium]
MNSQLQTISETVQANCHIADAAFATDFTLCVYLMKMREFYRWEMGYGFTDGLPQSDVGHWLRQREELWESLEDTDYTPITVDNKSFDPFHTADINQRLIPQGYVYSGGLGYRTKPHFFLAELESQRTEDDFNILITGKEMARDLSSPPAMTLGKTIFIRRESLRRLLWEKVEQWNWNKPDNPMARALAMYDFNHDVDRSLDKMTENELTAVLMHETGEVMAGKLLGEEWEAMLVELPRSKAEFLLRATRDHLADALATLPYLVESDNEASIHFYLGNLNNLRKDLFPSLKTVYQNWLDSRSLKPFKEIIEVSHDHWLTVANQALTIFRQHDPDWVKQIDTMIEANRL